MEKSKREIELRTLLEKEINEIKNPYPKDIFGWNNTERLDFDRGRFNRHCFEIFENARLELKKQLIGGDRE